jgi:methylated-DNA-[protein]-cysteine S-methyltransferase
MRNFSSKALELAKQIPEGRVTTYSEIARALNSRACRAAGQALKRNTNPIVVPCHRVVRSDGSLGGYSQGIRKKAELLKKEGIEISNGRIYLKKFFYSF